MAALLPKFLDEPLKWLFARKQVAELSRELKLVRIELAYLRNLANAGAYDALAVPDQRTAFRLREMKVFSQNGEDGILLYLFSRIGARARRFVEIGVGDGRECNTANLSVNFGWTGCVVEGAPEAARSAREHFDRLAPGRVDTIAARVDAECVDGLVAGSARGELDLLSIDIDGIDWWVWKAIRSIAPRVVVIEYNAVLPPERPLVVRYDPVFARREKHPSGAYFGASLGAYRKLAEEKGYILACCDSRGANAFFVKKELCEGIFRNLEPAEAYYPLSAGKRVRQAPSEAWKAIEHMPFDTL
jgi:hypothetical protein